MYKKLTTFLLLMIFLMAFASIANAQMGDQDRVRTELERTDQLLIRARDVVHASESPIGRVALEEAKRIRDASWDSFRNRRYGQAIEQTKLVRQLAERAIAAGRSAEENRELVRRKLEHTKELLERIRENAPGNVPEQFKALYRSATDNLQRAYEFFRAGQYRPALKLCNQVENAVRKIIEKIKNREQIKNRFEHRYEQIGDMIENNKEVIAECNSEKAQMMFNQAVRAYEKAGELYDKKNIEGAVKALQKAFKFMNKAVHECRGEAEFTDRLERIEAVYFTLVDEVESTDTRGQELLGQIREQLDLAKNAYDSGNLDAANAALRAANMKIKQLRHYLNQE